MAIASTTAPTRRKFSSGSLRELPALALLLAVCLYGFLTVPSFRGTENLSQVSQEVGILGILACGQALVILTGGIDLSVGAVAAVAACIAGERMAAGTAWPIAVLLGILSGAAIGWLNGVLITFRKLSPILVTLGMLLGARAAITIYTHSVPYNSLPSAFTSVGHGTRPLLLLILLAAVFAVVLARGRFGRRLIATGGSEQAARLSGIDTQPILRRAYMTCGVTVAVAGLLMAAGANSAQSNLAEGYELEAIASVVIGGVRLTGGEGSVLGAALGAAIIVVLRNLLFLKGVPNEQYGLVTGIVILLAAFAELLRRSREARA